jgi:hypothetical protein
VFNAFLLTVCFPAALVGPVGPEDFLVSNSRGAIMGVSPFAFAENGKGRFAGCASDLFSI